MSPRSPSVLAEQLRAARGLFQKEAVRNGGLIVDVYHKTLDAQPLAVGSAPTQESLLA